MTFCVVEFLTQSATFRHPDFQNFHKTLYLPPPTTLIGLAGAAMGLSDKQSHDFFYENDISLGIYGSSEGYTKDLWKFRTKDKKSPTSIISKEILCNNHFIIVYGNESEKICRLIESAFLNPIYALTLGNSDSLAKMTANTPMVSNELSYNHEFENCMVEGDIIQDVFENLDVDIEFSLYSSSEPISYDLPVQFKFPKGDYNYREVALRKQFSIVTEKVKVQENLKKPGVWFTDKNYIIRFIPIFNLR